MAAHTLILSLEERQGGEVTVPTWTGNVSTA